MAKRRRHRFWWVPAPFRDRVRYVMASGTVQRRTMWVGAGLLVLGALWIVVTGLIAKAEVAKIESQLKRVRLLVSEGRITEAKQAAIGIPGLSRRAHLLTTGPAWWTAAHIPFFGDPLKVMRGSAAAGKEVGVDGVQTLLDVAATLDPSNLRLHGDTINIAALQNAAPKLAIAAHALDNAVRTVNGLPSSTWFSPINHARQSFALQLNSIVGYIDAAANATAIMPTMMGETRPMRYFIGLQNEAELRGTGGLPGAFAIAVVSKGKITFTHFLSDAALLPPPTQEVPTGLRFSQGFEAAYGFNDPTSFIVNSNMSPHFPYAAATWAAMWQRVSGEKVDGALALDPTVLSYFLSVTGPAILPDGTVISSANIVSLTERDEYALFSDNLKRKDFLVAVLKAASKKLTSGAGSATTLARTMTAASNQQRLLIWSANPAIQKVLETTSYAGAIPEGARPLSALILNNTASGKLDFYLVRGLDYRRTGCGFVRDVFVTITLQNLAPPSGLPPYVYARIDKRNYSIKPGDNRTLVDYYATGGAALLSATLNGKQTTISVESDRGKTIFRRDIELPRGETQTLTLHLIEPAGKGTPQMWTQPGVTALQLKYFNQTC